MSSMEKQQEMKKIIRVPYELDVNYSCFGSLYGFINEEKGVYTILGWEGNEPDNSTRAYEIGSMFRPPPNIHITGFGTKPSTVFGLLEKQWGDNGQLVQIENKFYLVDAEGSPSIELQKEVYSDFNTRKKYIDMEIPHINNFLLDFNFSDPNIRPEIIIDDNYNWFGIRNFPLPDDFYPDYIDIAIVTGKYPVCVHAGFYINSESVNKPKIKDRVGNSCRISNEVNSQADCVFELPGWSWIDFRHYENSWQRSITYDSIKNINLLKFVKSIYECLWEKNHD